MKKKGKFTIVFAALTLLFSAAAFAGSLDAPSAPGSTSSYTLEDIWNRLNDGTDGSQSTFTEPGAVPGSTGYTIDDVMGKAPAKDDTNGATPGDVLTGKTFWGLTGGAWGLQTGTAAFLPTEAVRKSGQTTLYAAGDDGDLEKGAAITSRFTDQSNGTVKDNLTGLIWLKDANCATVSPKTWANALTSVAALAPGACGLSDGSAAGDWRLPNVKELQSLIHFGYFNPALSNDAGDDKWGNGTSSFTGVQPGYYWSATPSAGYTAYAWVVSLYDGDVGFGDKAVAYYVWPVR